MIWRVMLNFWNKVEQYKYDTWWLLFLSPKNSGLTRNMSRNAQEMEGKKRTEKESYKVNPQIVRIFVIYLTNPNLHFFVILVLE